MLEIGSLVGDKYKVLNVIGKGGMSTVYLAMNEKANKQWAIKEVRKDTSTNFQVVRQSLITETNLLKELSHPYLPSIIDVIEEEGRFLIVMDYIEGNTLEKALNLMGAQPQEYVIDWGIQLCDVLEYLHTRKPPIIYRDLKPGNIMLRPDGTITLIDFGIAREYKESQAGDTSYLGTKGYAAPEQFGGRGQTDARTDIYNLGATLYHLVTGHNPSEPPYEFYPIRYWDQQLSPGLEQIITRCIQNNPADRYQSCAEVMYDLQHYKELDKNYKKSAKLGVSLFLATSALTLIFGGLSLGFHNKSDTLAKQNYEYYIAEGRGEEDDATSFEYYAKAIEMDPENTRAYIEMLDNLILADDVFTRQEDERVRGLLIRETSNGTIGERLATNKEGYATVAYRLGVAYFYTYEGGSNPQASKWLKIAADQGTLSGSQQLRAERLNKIAEYRMVRPGDKSGGDSDKDPNAELTASGDPKVKYDVIWSDLVALADGNIAEEDNAITAMVIYNEIASQIDNYSSKFLKAGVKYEDMVAEMDAILVHLDEDILSDPNCSDMVKEKVKKTKSAFDVARKSLNIAAGK